MKIIAIVASLFLASCGFSRVDFKYSNLAHMNYSEAMIKVSKKPEELVYGLSDAFRHHGANILERRKIDFILKEADDGAKCWEANYEIFQKEFEAYSQNDFLMYQSIDREKPYSSRGVKSDCSFFINTQAPEADSWFLLVELPPRSDQTIVYRPTVENFFMFSQNRNIQGFSTSQVAEQVGISISTRLYVWAWRPSEGEETSVYLQAKPVSGQIEANQGKSIGYSWWKIANGYSEQQTVKNYISLIEEYDYKTKTNNN